MKIFIAFMKKKLNTQGSIAYYHNDVQCLWLDC